MNISIGKKSKGQNDILIVTSKSKLTGAVQTFVKQALELKKGVSFRIGYLPTIQGKDIFHTIIINLQDLQSFNNNMEDIVAELA